MRLWSTNGHGQHLYDVHPSTEETFGKRKMGFITFGHIWNKSFQCHEEFGHNAFKQQSFSMLFPVSSLFSSVMSWTLRLQS